MADFPATRASLLVRLRDPHDGVAWGQFVDLYAPLVYGYVRKQGLQDADAADLCQEVLTAVAGAVGRLEYDPQRGAFRNWLFTIVRRRLADWRAAGESRAVATQRRSNFWNRVLFLRRRKRAGRPSGSSVCSPGPANKFAP